MQVFVLYQYVPCSEGNIFTIFTLTCVPYFFTTTGFLHTSTRRPSPRFFTVTFCFPFHLSSRRSSAGNVTVLEPFACFWIIRTYSGVFCAIFTYVIETTLKVFRLPTPYLLNKRIHLRSILASLRLYFFKDSYRLILVT